MKIKWSIDQDLLSFSFHMNRTKAKKSVNPLKIKFKIENIIRLMEFRVWGLGYGV